MGERKANMLKCLDGGRRRLLSGVSGVIRTARGHFHISELFSTTFTAMVNCGAVLYSPASERTQVTRGAKRKEKSASADDLSVRATISFPPDM